MLSGDIVQAHRLSASFPGLPGDAAGDGPWSLLQAKEGLNH